MPDNLEAEKQRAEPTRGPTTTLAGIEARFTATYGSLAELHVSRRAGSGLWWARVTVDGVTVASSEATGLAAALVWLLWPEVMV